MTVPGPDIFRGAGAAMAAGLMALIPWQLAHEGIPASSPRPPAAASRAPAVTVTKTRIRVVRAYPRSRLPADRPAVVEYLHQTAPPGSGPHTHIRIPHAHTGHGQAPQPGPSPRPQPPPSPGPAPSPGPSPTGKPPCALQVDLLLKACLTLNLQGG